MVFSPGNATDVLPAAPGCATLGKDFLRYGAGQGGILMGRSNSKKNKSGRWLLVPELLLAAVILFCLGKIGYTLWQYRQGAAGYEAIRAQVTAPADSSDPAAPADGVDFASLLARYPDAVAWLRCDGTDLDYPVMQAADNDYYLRRLPDGTWNMSGSLFLDYRCAADFSDAVSVIYGHNMNDGSMLACLENYNDQSWYDAHPALELATPEADCTLPVLYGFEIPAQEWVDREFDTHPGALTEYAAAHTTFTGTAAWDGSSPLLALLTCTSHDDQVRYVVLCQLQTS